MVAAKRLRDAKLLVVIGVLLSGAIFHCLKKDKKLNPRKLQVTMEIFPSSDFIVGSLNTGLLQKQRSRGVLRKKCSENMQQI